MHLPHPHPEELFKAYLRIQSANNQIKFDKMGFFSHSQSSGVAELSWTYKKGEFLWTK